jgi:hypothetical protein
MSPRRFSSIASLVNDLLDRHEESAGTTRPIASVDNDGFATVDQRDAFDEVLEALEQNGGIHLIRVGRGAERVVTGARLKDAALLYAHVGRQPAAQLADDALAGLRARHREAPHIARMLNDTASTWSRGVSFLGIARNDVRTLEQVIGLAEAMHGRLTKPTGDEVDFRSFSRLSVSDSKALERNTRAVMAVFLRLFQSDGASSALKPEEFLSSIGVKRLPQPMLMRGAVMLDDMALPVLPFVGIPSECVDRIQLAHVPDYVITIENYTSFVRYVREVGRNDHGLVIYTGGFPSRPTLETIARLAALAKAPTYHWGDMDAGGVRIFHHIEQRLKSVGVELRPHMMDADLLRRVGSPVPGAARITGDVSGSAVADLAEVIRNMGLVHEQEELAPQRPRENCSENNV